MQKKQTKIYIKNIVKDSQVLLLDDGRKVFQKIDEAFKNDQKVLLSFEGVDISTSVFFASSLGRLCQIYGPNKLRRDIKYDGADIRKLIFIESVINNAAKFFKKKKE